MSTLWWFGCLLLFANFNVILVQCQFPGFYGPHVPYPVYVGGDDNDDWQVILPILLLMLADGGFGGGNGGFGGGRGYGGGCAGCGGCGGCSGDYGSKTIPIPYPIPIPVNNPIIT